MGGGEQDVLPPDPVPRLRVVRKREWVLHGVEQGNVAGARARVVDGEQEVAPEPLEGVELVPEAAEARQALQPRARARPMVVGAGGRDGWR